MTDRGAPVPSEKACSLCRTVKPLDAFSPDAFQVDGRASRCKACRSTVERERRAALGDDARKASRAFAYAAAGVRLRQLHRDEFDALYAEELRHRGHAPALRGRPIRSRRRSEAHESPDVGLERRGRGNTA